VVQWFTKKDYKRFLKINLLVMAKKEIVLQSAEYKLLCKGYAEWLQTLNYATVSQHSRQVQYFLSYQEQNEKYSIDQLVATDPNGFIQTKIAASNNHINKIIQSLKLFSKYLRQTGKSIIGFALERLAAERRKPVWLTKAAIQQLYAAIPNTILGIRDTAILAVYYGCGVRLNEGKNIQLQDIDYNKKILHIKKGKGYKERFIPIAEKSFNDITNYINVARPQLVQEKTKNDYLFIGANTGKVMEKQSIYIRIKRLAKIAKLKQPIGTHTLRHSIATHLLQSGMQLEKIKEFLGHSQLDSTQIYTHLKNELQ
jgi:integrase/recombinase XerD